MSYTVIFSPEAEEQLVELYRYVAEAASPEVAAEFTDAIVAYCEELKDFPQRGTMRDDIRSRLRITHYKKRTIIGSQFWTTPLPLSASTMADRTMKKNSTTQRLATHTDISEDERNICPILCSISDTKSHICSHVNRIFSRNTNDYKVFLSINVVGLPLARMLEAC